MEFEFRPYQEVLISQIKKYLLNSQDCLIEQPTGSGKTFEIIALTALLLRSKFSHIVISAPQRQIENGFIISNTEQSVFKPHIPNISVSDIVVNKDLIKLIRDVGRDSITSNLKRYFADNTSDYAVACTHAALTQDEIKNALPEDLTNRLLVIDEAHHAPAESLDEFVSLWKSRGGNLLYATATPYRNDGKSVVRENMHVCRRLFAEHMEEGFAPASMNNEIIGVSVEDEVSADEFTGEGISAKDHRKIIIGKLCEKYALDNKPKTIIRVPIGNSTEFIEELTEELNNNFPGLRILNGAGTSKEDQDRFINALSNPKEKDYYTSQYDIVIGVQRVLEGTDWSVCSHVYCVGVPGSLTIVTQLIGRSMRLKKENHPWRNSSAISFFVLGACDNTLKNLEIKHSKHVLLSCAFMADYNIGQEWAAIKPVIKALNGLKEEGVLSEDKCQELIDDSKKVISNEDRVLVQLLVTEARETALAEGRPEPTIGELSEIILKSDYDISLDVSNQVLVESLATSLSGDEVKRQIERKVKECINLYPSIDKAKKAIFEEIVGQFRESTLEKCESGLAFVNQIHKISGGNIRDFCGRLTGNYFASYQEAEKYAHNIGLKSQREWNIYCNSGNKPDNIPNSPDKYYKYKGWGGWGNFLGTSRAKSHIVKCLPLEHGEKIRVLWGNGEVTAETIHIIPYMTNHYGQGGSDIIEHKEAYIKVFHNGSPVNIRLHSANLLCERV